MKVTTLEIDGRDVKFGSHGWSVMEYDKEFGRNYSADINSMFKSVQSFVTNEEGVKLDLPLMYDLIFFFAKTADKNIENKEEFFSSFDEFPVLSVAMNLQEFLFSILHTKVDKVKKK